MSQSVDTCKTMDSNDDIHKYTMFPKKLKKFLLKLLFLKNRPCPK